MISFHYQNDFTHIDARNYRRWLCEVASVENNVIRKLDYIFCSDDYLLEINQQFLDHDTYTDIITFDYSSEGMLEGEIYISTDRVKDNAAVFDVDESDELRRVIVHGLLHLMGYGDKTLHEKNLMREKESEMMQMFHVKQ
ncbi:rRNA maturation RNase YbeY [Nonlabens spongiae]|uniref:Endoribonuclease YbeY n=1 Tax=Nonlabens spongiae TaxID=331648 RepID=A0A1W6MLJ7_9FLAO|nr:rRNA maturation RNase YbeY [Nonlabens spongiae]ARN78475.1 rRNA maturation RNase YbeY [Nonlabens spongiae]